MVVGNHGIGKAMALQRQQVYGSLLSPGPGDCQGKRGNGGTIMAANTIDKDMVTTGVHSINDLEQWMFDEEGIDLDQLEHVRLEHEGNAEACECDCMEQGTTLYGSWKLDEAGKYEPDTSGEYAAIYSPDFGTVQVVHSHVTVPCRKCSPCFPGQGDVDAPGSDYLAYILPLSLLNEGWLTENKARIVNLD
jgi:hypothetical protein